MSEDEILQLAQDQQEYKLLRQQLKVILDDYDEIETTNQLDVIVWVHDIVIETIRMWVGDQPSDLQARAYEIEYAKHDHTPIAGYFNSLYDDGWDQEIPE